MKSKPRARSLDAAPTASRVKRAVVLADGDKRAITQLLAELVPWLSERGVASEVVEDLRAFDGGAKPPGPRPDLVVVLGGDGAILSAVRAYATDPVPTIGINFGRVGFLASVEAAHWREALAEALEGRSVVEPRMRLAVEVLGEKPARAVGLNDAVLTRGAFQGMLTIALKVGGHWVTNYRADGLVVATPSGSTAYAMAAGGPILAPSMDAFVVAPVSPQALSHRPLVADGRETLELHVVKASGLTTLVVDGHGFFPLVEGGAVRITKHPLAYPLLSRPGFDPYTRLRDRLGWRGSNEPDVFPSDELSRPSDVDPGEGGVL